MLVCEGKLSLTECHKALQKFPNGKTPGNDGLTAEFYKCFWNLLGQQLTDSLNFSFENGELSNSQKQAVIRLIDKKDRDRRYIKNWRPISLLNVDVKIASKALASRLEKVLPEIIHPDQYAYVKGRTIFDAVRTIDDIMEYTKIKQLPGLMVAFDFEKAFDSLSWPSLNGFLHCFPIFQAASSTTALRHKCLKYAGVLDKVTRCRPIFSSWLWRYCLSKFVAIRKSEELWLKIEK